MQFLSRTTQNFLSRYCYQMQSLDDAQLTLLSYGDEERALQSKPINVAFITSIRDVGACDLNGLTVDVGSGETQYMEGMPERLYRAIEEEGFPARIVGIITDDNPDSDRERANMNGYAFTPNGEGHWIHPRDLGSANGNSLGSLTHHIPSSFRAISGKTRADEKASAKVDFEAELWTIFKQMGAEVLISDHLMLRLHDTLDETRLGIGRALNVHPAITAIGHPLELRGPIPTQGAINRAIQSESGITWTGATLHVMNQTIDDGPQLAYAAPTPVYPNDTLQELRARNYVAAKGPVFLQGLGHYIENIYPNLSNIDWNRPCLSQRPLFPQNS